MRNSNGMKVKQITMLLIRQESLESFTGQNTLGCAPLNSVALHLPSGEKGTKALLQVVSVTYQKPGTCDISLFN